MRDKKKKVNFFITIRDTQNNTWQGSIEWLENKEKKEFRSALEMIKLMDSAIDKEDK